MRRSFSTSQGTVRRESATLVFFMHHPHVAMVAFYEDDDDPKKPRPDFESKKREGWAENAESPKADDSDHQRNIHVVRC
jgi:hypothetical protein